MKNYRNQTFEPCTRRMNRRTYYTVKKKRTDAHKSENIIALLPCAVYKKENASVFKIYKSDHDSHKSNRKVSCMISVSHGQVYKFQKYFEKQRRMMCDKGKI